jgi:hypothetical protein
MIMQRTHHHPQYKQVLAFDVRSTRFHKLNCSLLSAGTLGGSNVVDSVWWLLTKRYESGNVLVAFPFCFPGGYRVGRQPSQLHCIRIRQETLPVYVMPHIAFRSFRFLLPVSYHCAPVQIIMIHHKTASVSN